MRIPNFKEPELTKFLTEWDREIDRLRKDALSKVTANQSVLLQSPGNKVWEVTVTDAGALVLTKVAG